MIEVKEAIKKLEDAIYGKDKEIDLYDLHDCLQVIKDISNEQDVKRNEVIATGRVKNFEFIKYKNKPSGIYKFLLEKGRKLSGGDYIHGTITCVLVEDRLKDNIMDGDRVKIWGDFSPYQIERNGETIEKMRIFLDKVERIPYGSDNYTPLHKLRQEEGYKYD